MSPAMAAGVTDRLWSGRPSDFVGSLRAAEGGKSGVRVHHDSVGIPDNHDSNYESEIRREQLNDLGREGWEVVTVWNENYVLLKRPISK